MPNFGLPVDIEFAVKVAATLAILAFFIGASGAIARAECVEPENIRLGEILETIGGLLLYMAFGCAVYVSISSIWR